jgi:hypothetical protein
LGRPRSARDTVAVETPAASATSLIVIAMTHDCNISGKCTTAYMKVLQKDGLPSKTEPVHDSIQKVGFAHHHMV